MGSDPERARRPWELAAHGDAAASLVAAVGAAVAATGELRDAVLAAETLALQHRLQAAAAVERLTTVANMLHAVQPGAEREPDVAGEAFRDAATAAGGLAEAIVAALAAEHADERARRTEGVAEQAVDLASRVESLARSRFAWELAADELEWICRERMQPGQRLPTQRELADRLGISQSELSARVLPQLMRRGVVVWHEEGGMGTPSGEPQHEPPRERRLLRHVVAERLKALVQTLAPGDPLPSIGRLAHDHGVSKPTVAAALSLLQDVHVVERDGLLWRRASSHTASPGRRPEEGNR